MISQKITAWSFSRYNEYRQCPFKAKCKIILKLKEPGSEAMDRGSAIHKKLEDYLAGKTKDLPEEAKSLAREYKALKKTKPAVELEVTFTSDWNITGWFDKNAWCRVKIDALVHPSVKNPIVKLKDHKTGKLKEHGEYEEQLELYGLTGLLAFPIAEKAETSLLFVDHGKEIVSETYHSKDIAKLKKKWEIMVKPMLNDTKFEPRPGNYCRWCHFSKDKGGPCKY